MALWPQKIFLPGYVRAVWIFVVLRPKVV